ncbi:MAG: hypothetical protein M1832_002120 [Thelocarpon impressellum]|nr:MAG: hypothetical protein M1832_002120 [Thelocarpon impressellum]
MDSIPGYRPDALPTEWCTLKLCPILYAYVRYQPSLPGNGFYLALFGVLLGAHIYLGVRYRTWGFLAGMVGGLILEIIGYVGRIMMHYNPFFRGNFLIYLVCLTIGPAFLNAAIYLSLSRVVVVYGEHVSRVRPGVYTCLFIGCDIFSLVLQSIGGASASMARDMAGTDTGVKIMAAGLGFQVASLVLFIGLCTEFAFRCRKHRQILNPVHKQLRESFLFKACLASLAFASLAILARSIFRVVELSEGFLGRLANDEPAFMVADGTMIAVACIVLTVFHPGFCFKGEWGRADFSLRKERKPAPISKDVESDSVQSLMGGLSRDMHPPKAYIYTETPKAFDGRRTDAPRPHVFAEASPRSSAGGPGLTEMPKAYVYAESPLIYAQSLQKMHPHVTVYPVQI